MFFPILISYTALKKKKKKNHTNSETKWNKKKNMEMKK